MAKKMYVGDDRLFRMVFKDSTGAELTPVSGTVTIKTTSNATIIEDVVATISLNEITYQYDDLIAGHFKLYFTADFGAEAVTDTITFRVLAKDGVTN